MSSSNMNANANNATTTVPSSGSTLRRRIPQQQQQQQLKLAVLLLLLQLFSTSSLVATTTSAFQPAPWSSSSRGRLRRHQRASLVAATQKPSGNRQGRRVVSATSSTTFLLSASSSDGGSSSSSRSRTQQPTPTAADSYSSSFYSFSNNTAAAAAFVASEPTAAAAADGDLLRMGNEIVYFPTLSSSTATAATTATTENEGAVLAEDSSERMTTTTQVVVVGTAQQQQQQQLDQQQAVQWARLLLLGAAALYGTNFSCVKLLGDALPVGIASTLRFGMAALATSPWLLLPQRGEEEEGSPTSSAPALSQHQQATTTAPLLLNAEARGAIVAGLEVGLWNSIGYVAQAVGLETTLASKSAFLCSLAVVTVPVLDWMTGKRLQQREWLGAVLALAGVAFLELGGDGGLRELLQFNKGDVASLLQPLAFGMGFWRMERAMHRFPDQAQRSTAAQLLAVFLGSLVYTAATDVSSLLDVAQLQQWLGDPSIVGALLWTGVVTTAVSVYMETLALKTLSAAETTLIFSTEPVWGSLFAAWFMGETFGWDAWAGGALILTACVYSNLGWQGLRDLLQSAWNGGDGDPKRE